MSAQRSATEPAEHLAAALSLADSLQSGFAAQRAGHQRRARPVPVSRITG
ncbi:MAG: hypothetical protein JWQ26_6 [Modestobacter sp.]|jgi:hypothetical protein|nr:hypothetical protein [Modestobacter sp.]HEV7726780.1 hypothetical protein [Modestobacter sp.]